MIIDPGISIDPGYSCYDQLMESNAYVRMAGSTQPIQGKVWPGKFRMFSRVNLTIFKEWYISLISSIPTRRTIGTIKLLSSTQLVPSLTECGLI